VACWPRSTPALRLERANTLTLAGAPIDFDAGEPVIHEVLRRLSPGGDLRFYEALVAVDGGALRVEHMLVRYIVIKPGDEISRPPELLAHLDDPAQVERYASSRSGSSTRKASAAGSICGPSATCSAITNSSAARSGSMGREAVWPGSTCR
jgi:hypothetical protein